MKKPELFTEKLWRSVSKSKFVYAIQRYRGVLFVACIPIGLLVLILFLLPKAAPPRQDPATDLHSQGSSHAASTRYAIVLDAGSTGSRVHVFKFEHKQSGLQLISDTFEQLKPGLSSYPDDPEAAANSLRPLLKVAVNTVPKHLQATTPVSLKATAGLRLLPGDKADKILEAVRALLGAFPFSASADAVAILGGQDEGGFAWLTLNYLLGKLGGGPADTVAAIDLGGGSVQEAFALSADEAAAAPSGYVMPLKAAGKTYHVYVHSYLGYGLMAGRAKVIEALDGEQQGRGHPCFFSNYSGSYKYGGKEHVVAAAEAAAADFGACAGVGLKSLDVEAACGAEQALCSFNGAWRGQAPASSKQRSYYVSSYFWDRAQESGIIEEAAAISWVTSIEKFQAKAKAACSSDLASLPALFPAVKPDAAPYFCLDLTYCHTLLVHGFRLAATEKLTLVKQVEYNGQNIEAAWPLGAALNDLS